MLQHKLAAPGNSLAARSCIVRARKSGLIKLLRFYIAAPNLLLGERKGELHVRSSFFCSNVAESACIYTMVGSALVLMEHISNLQCGRFVGCRRLTTCARRNVLARWMDECKAKRSQKRRSAHSSTARGLDAPRRRRRLRKTPGKCEPFYYT